MPLETAPTESPDVNTLFEAAKLTASPESGISSREIRYELLRNKGTVKTGDSLTIHRAADRDVKKGEVASLVLNIRDVQDGKNGVVVLYEVEGTYGKGNTIRPINGQLFLTEGSLQVLQPDDSVGRGILSTTTAQSGFQFASATDPVRIYHQFPTPPAEFTSPSVTESADAEPASAQPDPEIAVPQAAARSRLSQALAGLRKGLPWNKS